MPRTTRPQQARAVATRDAIVRAAATVFDERGYSGATIEQILDEAQVTKGALYFHFDAKADLAVAVMNELDRLWEDVRERVVKEATTHHWARLETLRQVGFAVAEECQKNVLVSAGVRLGDEWRTIPVELPSTLTDWMRNASQLLRAAQRAGEVLPTVDCDRAARVLICAIQGAERISRRPGECRDGLLEKVDEIWETILPGLTGAPA